MSNDNMLTDEYVAGLLADEAKDYSLRYSAMGMEAFRPNKKPANLPKPNTRFLRHIIRDTDSHNKALLAKETTESRARLKDLDRAEEVKRLRTNPDARDIRRRQMGDIHAILGGKQRPRHDDGKAFRTRDKDEKRHGDEKCSSHRGGLLQSACHDDKRQGRRAEYGHRTRDSSRGEDNTRPRRARSDGSPSSEEHRHHRHGRSRRERSRSPRRHRRSGSPREEKRRHRRRSRHRSPSQDLPGPSRRPADGKQEDDSDPLDEFIGPAPPPRYRGRGTIGGAANLDRRFSESYDPKVDVQLDSNAEDDWDDAVEAFRDRQRLRQAQEQRMRAAGFAEEHIQKIRAGAEKTERDVVWSKAGEKRAWDRGKLLGEELDEPPTLFSEDS